MEDPNCYLANISLKKLKSLCLLGREKVCRLVFFCNGKVLLTVWEKKENVPLVGRSLIKLHFKLQLKLQFSHKRSRVLCHIIIIMRCSNHNFILFKL